MPKLNLGRVVGRDGGFGNIDTVYLNDGGAPSVTVEASGEDTAKDFVFTFKNLVRDVATADEVEQIAAGEIVQSSNVITAGVMSSIWAKIKGAFAQKSHTHDASDITAGELAAALIANGLITDDMLATGAVTTAKISDGAVTNAKLDQTLRDSLSQNIGTARLADKCVTAAKIADGVLPARSKQNMSPMTIERYGKVRILTVLYSNTPLVANYNYNVATLPAGDRPQAFTRGIATSTGGGELILNVNTNGTVVLSTAGDAATSNANVQAISVYTVA